MAEPHALYMRSLFLYIYLLMIDVFKGHTNGLFPQVSTLCMASSKKFLSFREGQKRTSFSAIVDI